MKWILYCPKCAGVTTHSLISETDLAGYDPYATLRKPVFPDGGLSVICPSCGETSVYQRHQLVFRRS